MDTKIDLAPMMAVVDDDQLYAIFAEADATNDEPLATAAADEIQRRANGPAPTIHNLPAWLAKLLPRSAWHQKPEG